MKILICLLFLLSASVQADDAARYQMLLVQEGSTTENGNFQLPRVLILDSEKGHMWSWGTELERRDRIPHRVKTLTYEGQLVPGKHAGEQMSKSDTE